METIQRSIMRHRLVLGALGVMRAYDRAGGGMLAGGLSYFGFFTVVPALLLFVSLLGVLIEDAALRADLIDGLIGQLDPLNPVATAVIDGLAGSGRTGTVVGVLGLLWGGSGFYGALQGSMQRMFPGPGIRDFFRTRLRGILAVVLILGSMLSAVLLLFVLPTVADWLTTVCKGLTEFDTQLAEGICAVDVGRVGDAVGPVAAMGVAFLAAMFVYVAIPPDGPNVRQAFVPAIIAGIGIGLLTSLFGWVAPLLVRNFSGLGVVGSVFIALIWFNLVFQFLLYGAAIARLRRDRDRTRSGPPSF
ncbi:MAG: YihY/virulence factor BrkB family protein [Chloroflexota bacterium]